MRGLSWLFSGWSRSGCHKACAYCGRHTNAEHAADVERLGTILSEQLVAGWESFRSGTGEQVDPWQV